MTQAVRRPAGGGADAALPGSSGGQDGVGLVAAAAAAVAVAAAGS